MAIRNAKDFGTAIRERRKRLGYTQESLPRCATWA